MLQNWEERRRERRRRSGGEEESECEFLVSFGFQQRSSRFKNLRLGERK